MKRFAILFIAFAIAGILGFSVAQAPQHKVTANSSVSENKPVAEAPTRYYSFEPETIEFPDSYSIKQYIHIPYVFPEREESTGMLLRSTDQKNFIIISSGTIYARELEAGDENQPPKN